MKRCYKCAKQFDDHYSACDVDGSRLIGEDVVNRYEVMGKIFGGAMSEMLGDRHNIDAFYDFDKTSWDALADKRANDRRVQKYSIVASVIFYCANQSALHFHEDCKQEESANHLDKLVEFICLYVVILKRTSISNEGLVSRLSFVWSQFMESLQNEIRNNLALDETQLREFWSMFTDLMSQREKLYKNSPLAYKLSERYSSDDIFSTFSRLMREQFRPGPRMKSVESAAIASAFIGLNIVPKIMDIFLTTSTSS